MRRAAFLILSGASLVLLTHGIAHSEDVERGREIYLQECAMCHGQEGEGMGGMHPALQGAVDRLTREGVEVTIRSGRDVTPPMPAFDDRLTDEEIEHVIAYLETLPDGPRRFGPEMEDDRGMMGDGMMGDGLWPAVTVLAALVAGLLGGILGYALARRR